MSNDNNNNQNIKKKTSPRDNGFWYWLLFSDILIGFNFSLILFVTPILNNFHTLLTDCSRQGTYEGCMAADSNEDTSCIWNATTSTCSFADQFDCSVFNNDSIKCATDSSAAEFCYYRFLSGSGSGKNSGICLHKSGWSDVQVGLIAAFSVMGGIFAPFSMQKLSEKTGFPFTVALCGVLCLVASTIFSIAVENGQNFAMYLVARVLISITAYTSSYLYPSMMSQNSGHSNHQIGGGHINSRNPSRLGTSRHQSRQISALPSPKEKEDNTNDNNKNSNEPTATILAPTFQEEQDQQNEENQQQEPERIMEKYFVVSQQERTTHGRIMGNTIGVVGLIQAVYLFLVSNEGLEAQKSGIRSASLIHLDSFEDFKMKLQIYNMFQFIVGAAFLLFAFLLRYYNSLEVPEEQDDEDMKDQKTISSDETAIAVAHDSDQKDAVIANEPLQQEDSQTTTAAIAIASPAVDDANKEVPPIDPEIINFLLAPPCSPPCASKNAVLMWCGGLLLPTVLQLSSSSAVMSYSPDIMGDVLQNALMSQIVSTGPMCVGSLFGLFALSPFFTPLEIFIVGGFLSSIGAVIIGVGLYLPTMVQDGSLDDTGATLSIFGLVFFCFVFFAGPGTMIFSAMIEVYSSIDLPKIPSRKEFSRIATAVAASPEQRQFEESYSFNAIMARQQQQNGSASPSAPGTKKNQQQKTLGGIPSSASQKQLFSLLPNMTPQPSYANVLLDEDEHGNQIFHEVDEDEDEEQEENQNHQHQEENSSTSTPAPKTTTTSASPSKKVSLASSLTNIHQAQAAVSRDQSSSTLAADAVPAIAVEEDDEKQKQDENNNNEEEQEEELPCSPLDDLHDRHDLLHLLHKHQLELLAFGISISGSFTGCLQFSFRFAFPVFVETIYPDDVRVGRAIAFFGYASISFLANVLLVVTQMARGRNVGAPKAVVKIVDLITPSCCWSCQEEEQEESSSNEKDSDVKK